MRKASWISIALIFVWPCGAWSTVQPLEFKVKDDVLLAKAMEGGMSLSLPEFFCFHSNRYCDLSRQGLRYDIYEPARKCNALEHADRSKRQLARCVCRCRKNGRLSDVAR